MIGNLPFLMSCYCYDLWLYLTVLCVLLFIYPTRLLLDAMTKKKKYFCTIWKVLHLFNNCSLDLIVMSRALEVK